MMAKKKKTKDLANTHKYSVELSGLIIILIGIIGFGFGYIGYLLKMFAMFLAGTWWILILIYLIVIGGYMLYKREMPKFTSPKLIGLYLLFSIILVASHFQFINLNTPPKKIITITKDNFMARMSSIPQHNAINSNGTSTIIIGGGMVGAVFTATLSSLFDKTGTIIILSLCFILSLILLFNINLSIIFQKLFNKIKELLKKKPKKVVEDNVPISSAVEIPKEKIVITSMDELRQRNDNEEVSYPKQVNLDNKEVEDYIFPKFNQIFDPIKPKKANLNEYTRSNQEILVRVLRDFGINAEVKDKHVGPAVTEYELVVPAGTKVSKIININKEIALALAAKDVIIEAPIPGKNTIGIEIPNPTISNVGLREVLESNEYLKSNAKICVALGKNIMGVSKVIDLTKMPHLLVAGSTGSGKSVCINSFIASILMRYKPNEVKLVLVDPKKVELTNYNGIPHLLCPVVNDPKKASLTLQKVVNEMDNRFQIFSDKEVKNIARYNELIEKENRRHPEKPTPKMPYIIVIIDELADLMLIASREVQDSIMRITQLARACGIHLIVATQRPSTDVITGLIKNNIPSRISFAVSSQIDSRTILDQSGAEKLLGKGDMLYFPMGENAPTRVQGCIINDNEIKRLIDYCKTQGSTNYDKVFTNVEENNLSSYNDNNNNNFGSDDEQTYNEVLEFAIRAGKISASLIQRRFRFGYNRAARIMDLLEERGIVGPQNGSKPREVLVKLEEKPNDD